LDAISFCETAYLFSVKWFLSPIAILAVVLAEIFFIVALNNSCWDHSHIFDDTDGYHSIHSSIYYLHLFYRLRAQKPLVDRKKYIKNLISTLAVTQVFYLFWYPIAFEDNWPHVIRILIFWTKIAILLLSSRSLNFFWFILYERKKYFEFFFLMEKSYNKKWNKSVLIFFTYGLTQLMACN
jgi:hypothetical protein